MRLASPNLPVLAIKQTLEEVDRQLQVVRTTLRRASGRQKGYADLCRSSRGFKEGRKYF